MYDAILIGAGTAGMACAIEAAHQGLRVLVLEKDDKPGGALHWSGGHLSAGGCRRQKAQGIEDSPEQHLADILRINGHTGDLDLIRLAVAEAPATIDWLQDAGFDFAPECPRIIYGHVPYTLPRTVYGKDKGLSILRVLQKMWDRAIATAHIQVHFSHAVYDIGTTDGRFDTVHTIDAAQQRHTFTGRHIVLTTGGYGKAAAYFKQKHPHTPLVSAAYPQATADGHVLLEKKGAAFRFAQYHVPSLGGLELEPGSGVCDFNQSWAMVLTSVYRQPREIYLNAHGHRFMPEDEINADTRERWVAAQPDSCFWALFDETALMERNADGSENALIIGWPSEKMKAEARREKAIWQADTLPELAEKCGLPIEAVLASVATFNQVVAQQQDALLGRQYLQNTITQAPFFAVKIHASVLVTFGGIAVNDRLQVLATDGSILPGLYAAGEILGLGATSGAAFCSGMGLTPALSFGRRVVRFLDCARNDSRQM